MKGERKLRLVRGSPDGGSAPKPPPASPHLAGVAEGEEPPFTDDEIAAAAALRDALAHGADPLAVDLLAAYAPRPLAGADLDAIVERALGDDAAATAAERAAAERLRDEGDPLFRALRLAAHPTEIDAARNEALIATALRARIRRGIRRIAPLTMAVLTGVAALAASMALFLGRPVATQPGAATAELARARSADGLFDAATPFPRHGEESARVDRIASARAADLRNNRFAAWGVK